MCATHRYSHILTVGLYDVGSHITSTVCKISTDLSFSMIDFVHSAQAQAQAHTYMQYSFPNFSNDRGQTHKVYIEILIPFSFASNSRCLHKHNIQYMDIVEWLWNCGSIIYTYTIYILVLYPVLVFSHFSNAKKYRF